MDPNVIEKSYLKELDTKAAQVHQKMISNQPFALTGDARLIWSRFLVSLMLRTPTMVRQIRQRGEEALLGEMDRDATEYDNARGGTDPATLRQLFELLLPHLPRDFGVLTLPQIIESEVLNGALLGSHWKMIGIPATIPRTFVLGDRPLIYTGKMASSYLVSLPISPRRVFFSFNHANTGKNLDRIGPSRLVRNLNVATARRAERHVFATDDSEAHNVKTNLSRSKGYSAAFTLRPVA